MKQHITCENEDDALVIAKDITSTIGSLDIKGKLTENELRSIIRKANAIAKWGRGALSKILLAKTEGPKPYWQCQECMHEDRERPMPDSREKFYTNDPPACPKCKSQAFIPIGW